MHQEHFRFHLCFILVFTRNLELPLDFEKQPGCSGSELEGLKHWGGRVPWGKEIYQRPGGQMLASHLGIKAGEVSRPY